MSAHWKIRPAKGQDLNFLYSTWLNSFRCDSALGRSVKKSVFFAEYYGVLDALLQRPQCRTLVACLPDEELVILGFVVFEPQVLHYCFTKQSFRRLGIARSLCETAFGADAETEEGVGVPPVPGTLYFTHKTRCAEPILETHHALLYNPFLLFSKLFPETKPSEVKNG